MKSPNKMMLTQKQHKVMNVILRGNTDAEGATISWCDIAQLIERLDYTPSRGSIHFSLRPLRDKGLIEIRTASEIRRSRKRTILVPTNLAFDKLGSGH